jgi:hypothetical protein
VLSRLLAARLAGSSIATLKGPRKKLGRVEVLPWQELLREMGL